MYSGGRLAGTCLVNPSDTYHKIDCASNLGMHSYDPNMIFQGHVTISKPLAWSTTASVSGSGEPPKEESIQPPAPQSPAPQCSHCVDVLEKYEYYCAQTVLRTVRRLSLAAFFSILRNRRHGPTVLLAIHYQENEAKSQPIPQSHCLICFKSNHLICCNVTLTSASTSGPLSSTHALNQNSSSGVDKSELTCWLEISDWHAASKFAIRYQARWSPLPAHSIKLVGSQSPAATSSPT